MLDVEPEHKFLNKTNIAIYVYLDSKLDYSLCFCYTRCIPTHARVKTLLFNI